jgi:nitrate reductase (NAD(P)H)
MAHAGRVHADTTGEFESIHDDYAHSKLQGTFDIAAGVID